MVFVRFILINHNASCVFGIQLRNLMLHKGDQKENSSKYPIISYNKSIRVVYCGIRTICV